MIRSVGVPAEIKDGERRVALDPAAVKMVVDRGIPVRVQSGAGVGAGFEDAAYRGAGADIVGDPAGAWDADLVVKVKEPQSDEFAHFRAGLHLFAFLHLAAAATLTERLCEARVEAHAFETVEDASGGLPLLAPMSEIAGRAAVIVGTAALATHPGGLCGSGTLIGGAAGVPPGRVVVIGLGIAGTCAARGARGLDAEVTGIDLDLERLYEAKKQGIVTATAASSDAAVAEATATADLVIGAALVPGAIAPTVVRAEHIAAMRTGSVVVDLAIDQGGCVETARPTSLSDPTYGVDGVLHYCVTNVPGQYPRTASRALSAALAPRILSLVTDPDHSSLRGSLNTKDGRVVHPTVAAALS